MAAYSSMHSSAHSIFYTGSTTVFTLESGSHMASDKLTSSDHIPVGGEQVDLPMMVHNISLETRSMKGQLGTLKTQISSLCGEEGQLGKLKAELGIVNASTHLLQDKFETLSRKAGMTQ